MAMSRRYEARDGGHCTSLLHQLNAQRERGAFCDVTIVVEDSKFKAHKNVLAAFSPYFQGLLAQRGSWPLQPVLELREVKAEVFAKILGFLYSSRLVVERPDEARELAAAGQRLGITFLEDLSSRGPDYSHQGAPAPEGQRRRSERAQTWPGDSDFSSHNPAGPSFPIDLTSSCGKGTTWEASGLGSGPQAPLEEVVEEGAADRRLYTLSTTAFQGLGFNLEEGAGASRPHGKERGEGEEASSLHAKPTVECIPRLQLRLHRARKTLSCPHCHKAFVHLKRLQSHQAACRWAGAVSVAQAQVQTKAQAQAQSQIQAQDQIQGQTQLPHNKLGPGTRALTQGHLPADEMGSTTHPSRPEPLTQPRLPTDKLGPDMPLHPPKPLTQPQLSPDDLGPTTTPLPRPEPLTQAPLTPDELGSTTIPQSIPDPLIQAQARLPPEELGPATTPLSRPEPLTQVLTQPQLSPDELGPATIPLSRPELLTQALTKAQLHSSEIGPTTTPLSRPDSLTQDEHFMKVVDGHLLYFCAVCQRSYMTLSSLRRHANVHSWRRRYPCRYCDKIFALAEYRTKHEVWHTGERRYQCIFCWDTFVTYYNLKTHQRAAHGLDPGLTISQKTPNGGYKPRLNAFKLYRLLPMRSHKRPYKTYSQASTGSRGGPGGLVLEPEAPVTKGSELGALELERGEPAVPALDRARPEVSALERGEQEVPASDKARSGVLALEGGELGVPAPDRARPGVLASEGVEQGVPALEGVEQGVPASAPEPPSVITYGRTAKRSVIVHSRALAPAVQPSVIAYNGSGTSAPLPILPRAQSPSGPQRREPRGQKPKRQPAKTLTYVAKPACSGARHGPLCRITVRIGEEAIVKRRISESDLHRDKVGRGRRPEAGTGKSRAEGRERQAPPWPDCSPGAESAEEVSDQDSGDNLWRPYYSYKPKRRAGGFHRAKRSGWRRKLGLRPPGRWLHRNAKGSGTPGLLTEEQGPSEGTRGCSACREGPTTSGNQGKGPETTGLVHQELGPSEGLQGCSACGEGPASTGDQGPGGKKTAGRCRKRRLSEAGTRPSLDPGEERVGHSNAEEEEGQEPPAEPLGRQKLPAEEGRHAVPSPGPQLCTSMPPGAWANPGASSPQAGGQEEPTLARSDPNHQASPPRQTETGPADPPVQEHPIPLVTAGHCCPRPESQHKFAAYSPGEEGLSKAPFYPDPYPLVYGHPLLAGPYACPFGPVSPLPVALNMVIQDKGQPLPLLRRVFVYPGPCRDEAHPLAPPPASAAGGWGYWEPG
ncbi:zinc finger and BTB domain-containing protein 4-like [Narcine bancroftii]|uniref:zinc finger and BTB domain-containing protein 4-like n=1 Tax=Narcine bancroftii TaxID=1343680 RepID=UPI003831657B